MNLTLYREQRFFLVSCYAGRIAYIAGYPVISPAPIEAELHASRRRHTPFLHRLMHWLSLRIQPGEHQHLAVLSINAGRLQGDGDCLRFKALDRLQVTPWRIRGGCRALTADT